VFSVFLTLSWSCLGVLSSEAFPFKSRTTQLGIVVSFGRIGSIAANLVNPLLLEFSLIMPVAGLALLCGAGLALGGLEDNSAREV
jgi:hypothetical protein